MWGLQLDNNHLFLLACLLMGVLLASFPLSYLNLRGLEVQREVSSPLFAGSRFALRVVFANRKRWLSSCLVSVKTRVEGSGVPSHGALFLSLVPRIDASAQIELRQTGLFFRRGEKSFLGTELESVFPLGLYSFSRWIEAVDQVIVYPQISPLSPAVMPPRSDRARVRLEECAPSRGEEEFLGLREFKPGDNPKWIHWRSSAKLPDKLLMRELEDPTMRIVQIVLETRVRERDIGFAPRFERAIRLTASVIQQLVRSETVVDLTLRGDRDERVRIRPRTGGFEEVLHTLALIQPIRHSSPDGRGRDSNGDGLGPSLVIDPARLDPKLPLESLLKWDRVI